MATCRATLVLLALLLTVSSAAAQSTQPSRPSRPETPRETPKKLSSAAALNIAVKQLTQEARAAAKEGKLPRVKADFAGSFPHGVPPEAVLRKIIRPISRDAFVDGYVRWQLTSFNPSLDGLEPRKFEQMLVQLPAMGENPRAHADLLRMVEAMRRVNPLDETQKKSVSDQLDALGAVVSRARELNVPGLKFRAWLDRQYETDRFRRLELSLAQVAAHVAAGWSIDRLKPPLEKQFESGRWDDDFTDAQRRRVAVLAQDLVGRRRAVLATARVNQDRLEVEFDETAVYDFDVRRWLKALERDRA